MNGFDTVLVVDWSAASKKTAPAPSKDAIWIGVAQAGLLDEPIYCRSRLEAEIRINAILDRAGARGKRVLAAFDFPFGYPKGLARVITGQDDPFALWAWVAERIEDSASNANNRFDVAEEMNAKFDALGPFWGKSHRDRWPGIPYRKAGIDYAAFPFDERRLCDQAAQAASSCFQLFYNPTVGSQVLMGLPMLLRLRQRGNVAVWPLEDCGAAEVVLAEIWPGLVERGVQEAAKANPGDIRDRIQVRLLAYALSRLASEELSEMMIDLPEDAKEEAWILGTGHESRLNELTR